MRVLAIVLLLGGMCSAAEPIIQFAHVDQQLVLKADDFAPLAVQSSSVDLASEMQDLRETVKQLAFDVRLLKSEVGSMVDNVEAMCSTRDQAYKVLQNKVFALEEQKRKAETGKAPVHDWRQPASSWSSERSSSSRPVVVRTVRADRDGTKNPNGRYLWRKYDDGTHTVEDLHRTRNAGTMQSTSTSRSMSKLVPVAGSSPAMRSAPAVTMRRAVAPVRRLFGVELRRVQPTFGGFGGFGGGGFGMMGGCSGGG